MCLSLIRLQLASSVFDTCRFGQRRTMSRPSSPHTLDIPNYETWSREELIARLKELTRPSPSGPLASIPTQAQSSSLPPSAPQPQSPSPPTSKPVPKPPPKPKPTKKKAQTKRPAREFDFSAYPTRKIALKFSYAGAGYGGLAYQAEDGPTPLPLPTVEGVLFAALAKARLVDPEGGLEGCGWERCGRTDRGVSAAGQVVSLYARSSNGRSVSSPKTSVEGGATDSDIAAEGASGGGASGSDAPRASLDTPAPPVVAGEGTKASSTTTAIVTAARDIRYLHTLNGILPPSIRVYAWAPVAPSFSARFSCRARHYKYFFSARNLDVDAMRNGAARLVGEHDFRNLCKLDPAKQLTSFRRRILRADISSLLDDDDQHHSASWSRSRDGMHVFDLVGTAFLYNQVRHIMAVLLLVGARLESPSVISALLNTDPNREENNDNCSSSSSSAPAPSEDEAPPPLVTCKPEYQMADALPLVLWDCVYAEEDAPWRTDDAGSEGGSVGLHAQMTGLAERAQVEATLAEHFLAAASQFHAPAPAILRPPVPGERGPWDVPLGGGTMRREGTYVGLLKRKRLESVDVVNARYRDRKEAKSRARDDTG